MTRDEIAKAMNDSAGSDWGTEAHFQSFAALLKDRMIRNGWRQCAVGQKTTQFCGELEAAVAAEREACAKEVISFGREHPLNIESSIRETAKSIAKCIRARRNNAS